MRFEREAYALVQALVAAAEATVLNAVARGEGSDARRFFISAALIAATGILVLSALEPYVLALRRWGYGWAPAVMLVLVAGASMGGIVLLVAI